MVILGTNLKGLRASKASYPPTHYGADCGNCPRYTDNSPALGLETSQPSAEPSFKQTLMQSCSAATLCTKKENTWLHTGSLLWGQV